MPITLRPRIGKTQGMQFSINPPIKAKPVIRRILVIDGFEFIAVTAPPFNGGGVVIRFGLISIAVTLPSASQPSLLYRTPGSAV